MHGGEKSNEDAEEQDGGGGDKPGFQTLPGPPLRPRRPPRQGGAEKEGGDGYPEFGGIEIGRHGAQARLVDRGPSPPYRPASE